MPGPDTFTESLKLNDFPLASHPLRVIRAMFNAALGKLGRRLPVCTRMHIRARALNQVPRRKSICARWGCARSAALPTAALVHRTAAGRKRVGAAVFSKKRVTRREKFLSEMERVVPWGRLVALTEPKYPNSGRVGRQPIGLERMLRLYFVQQWLGLSDEGLEDAVVDSAALRHFIGVDLQAVPDATTLLKFRRLLEQHELTQAIFAEVNAQLEQQGLLLRAGTLIDATIIAAPSSTKNKDQQRDPEMASTKKGNNYHFGMKAHTGVDTDSGLVHS